MTTSTCAARRLRVSQPYGFVIGGEDVAASVTFDAIDPSTGIRASAPRCGGDVSLVRPAGRDRTPAR